MQYAKAILAALVSAIGAAVAVLGPGNENLSDLGTQDWLQIAAAVLASGGLVWLAQNIQGVAGGVIKAVLAAGSAFVASLIAAYSDNVISQGELLTAIGAAVVATGLVYQVANKPA